MSDTNKLNEENEKNGKKNSIDYKQNFIDDFCKSKMKDESKEREFLDTIFDSKNISGDLSNDLENFLSGGRSVSKILDESGNNFKSDDYPGVELKDIKLSDLKSKLFSKYCKLRTDRKLLESAINSDYEISGENKKSLFFGIKKLNQNELDNFKNIIQNNDKDKIGEYMRREKVVSKFLEDVLQKENLPNKKEKINIFSGITKFLGGLSEKEIIKINIENENTLSQLIELDEKFRKGEKLTSSYIDNLSRVLKLPGIGNETKKRIIIEYYPLIPFKKAKEIGIIDGGDIEIIKKQIIKKIFSDEEITEIGLNKILNAEKNIFENILLVTSDLLTDSNISSLIEDNAVNTNLISNIFSKYNQYLKEHDKNLDKNIKGFKEKLNKIEKVKGVENFKKGSFIIVKQTLSSGYKNNERTEEQKEESTLFIKILDNGEKDGKVKLLDHGTDLFTYGSQDIYSRSYDQLIHFINNANKKEKIESIDKFEIVSAEEMKRRLSDDGDDRKEGEDKIEKGINFNFSDKNDTEEIITKLESVKRELEEDKKKYYEKKGKTKEEIDKLIEEDDEILNLQNEITATQNIDKNELIRQLKIIDPTYDSTKFDFGVGTTFTTNDANGDFYYTIKYFDSSKTSENIIVTDFLNRSVILSSIDFINAFGKQKCRITSTSQEIMPDFGTMMEAIRSDENDKVRGNWKNFKFENNKILKTNTNNENENSGINYDYLVADGDDGKGNQLIQIHSIIGNEVKVSFGEYDEKIYSEDDDSKGVKKGDIKSKSFGVDTDQHTITIGELYSRIAKFKLRPRCLDEEKDVVDDDIKTQNITGSFWSRFFKRYSVKELLEGGKLGIDSIENYLKEGREENAAKFASGFFGTFLPEDLKNDLTTRVESAKKKRQDDYIQKLKDVDSSNATDMIIGWLKNRDVPQHKKEAGMIFMLEKYGVLYAKSLTEYKGSFLWYEAMGGKVGDKLYLEEKAKAEAKDMPFTEEQLMYILTIRQCKGKQPPKRRSRLHKDYNRCRNQGKEEEAKTGETDSQARRTIEGRIDYCFDEMGGGTYPNARGGFEKVITKGGPMHKMSEVPFVMLFSGLAYGYEENELDAWKSMVVKGTLIPITKFLGSSSSIDLFGRTVMKLCEIIGNQGEEKYKNILKDAEDVFSNQRKTEGDKAKIVRGRKFYEKYGKILTDSLSLLLLDDESNESQYADLIITHKDKKGNSVLKDYYKKIMDPDFLKFNDPDLMTDSFLYAGTSGMDMEKAVTDNLGLMTGGVLKDKHLGGTLWTEIVNGFRSMSRKKYYNDKDDNDKNIVIKDRLRNLLAGFVKNNGGSIDFIASYNTPGSIFSRLNDWGVYVGEISKRGITYDNLKNANNKKTEDLLDQWVKQIIDFEKNGKSSAHLIKSVSGSSSIADETINETIEAANKVIK